MEQEVLIAQVVSHRNTCEAFLWCLERQEEVWLAPANVDDYPRIPSSEEQNLPKTAPNAARARARVR